MSDPLLARAVEALGAFAPPLASESLERGMLTVSDTTTWEGSSGTMHGRRVVLAVPAELHVLLVASPASVDALTAAIAIAVSAANEVLADLVLEAGPHQALKHPYR